MLANKFRLSPLIGYLFAGILLGPQVPFIYNADLHLAHELSELGVILLMFGVGLHFSLKDLNSVKSLALPGALLQITGTIIFTALTGFFFGFDSFQSFIFGLCLSVASTVVLLRALEQLKLLETPSGKIATGWLIVEDLVTVVILVILPSLAFINTGAVFNLQSFLLDLLETAVNLVIFGVIIFYAGRKLIPAAISRSAATGSQELFTLSVLAISLGIAYVSVAVFDISFALGAFVAGMILNESELSHRAAEDTLPLRDAFAVLFFVSVGMLFDYHVLLEHALVVLYCTFIIVFVKSLFAYLIVRFYGRSHRAALTISASLAQIGEFSFILAGLSVSLGYIEDWQRDVILAGAVISIVVNPFLFLGIEKAIVYLERFDKTKDKPKAVEVKEAKAGKEAKVVNSQSVNPPTSASATNTPDLKQSEGDAVDTTMTATTTKLTSDSKTSVSEGDASLIHSTSQQLHSSSSTATSNNTEKASGSIAIEISDSLTDSVHSSNNLAGRSASQEAMLHGENVVDTVDVVKAGLNSNQAGKESYHDLVTQSATDNSLEIVSGHGTVAIEQTVACSEILNVEATQDGNDATVALANVQVGSSSDTVEVTLAADVSQVSVVATEVDVEADTEANTETNLDATTDQVVFTKDDLNKPVKPIAIEHIDEILESNEKFTNAELDLKDHYIVIGYSFVGKLIVEMLKARNVDFVVFTSHINELYELNAACIPCVYGDYADMDNYKAANIKQALGILFSNEKPYEVGYLVDKLYAKFTQLFQAESKFVISAFATHEDEIAFLRKHHVNRVLSVREITASFIVNDVLSATQIGNESTDASVATSTATKAALVSDTVVSNATSDVTSSMTNNVDAPATGTVTNNAVNSVASAVTNDDRQTDTGNASVDASVSK